MLSISMIFGLMMLPALAVLVTSFIVSFLESDPVSLTHKMFTRIDTKESSCWKVEL